MELEREPVFVVARLDGGDGRAKRADRVVRPPGASLRAREHLDGVRVLRLLRGDAPQLFDDGLVGAAVRFERLAE